MATFDEITKQTQQQLGEPPDTVVDGQPGNLLTIFRVGIEELETLRDTRPNDDLGVDVLFEGLMFALETWRKRRAVLLERQARSN